MDPGGSAVCGWREHRPRPGGRQHLPAVRSGGGWRCRVGAGCDDHRGAQGW